MSRVLRSPGAWLALLALVLALLLPGLRGIWDPDEGRYTNVALHMLASGDWLTPHRSEEVAHWTKPPLVYWAIAFAAVLQQRERLAGKRVGVILSGGNVDLDAMAQWFPSASRGLEA